MTKQTSNKQLSLVISFLLVCLLASSSLGTVCRAFSPAVAPLRPRSLLFAGAAQPETKVETKTKIKTSSKQEVVIKKSFKTDDPVQRRDDDFEEAPLYKLMLISDDAYDPEHVITRLCNIVEGMDEDAASTIYQQAMSSGQAMCGKYPFERAELFKEQLLRSNPMIFSDLKEENE